MKPLLMLLALVLAVPVQAATLYAKAAGGSWATAATWSSTGCAGGDSSGPPGVADDVILGTCAGVVLLDGFGAQAKTVTLAAGAQLSADPNACVNVGDCFVWLYATTGTVWSADPAAVLTLRLVQVALKATPTGTRIFAGGGQTYGALEIDTGTAAQATQLAGANTFGLLVLNSMAATAATLVLPASTTTTVFDFAPQFDTARWNLASSAAGTPATLSKSSGIIDVLLGAITDSHATGGATWCASPQAFDAGGNTGWQFISCPYVPLQSLTGVGR